MNLPTFTLAMHIVAVGCAAGIALIGCRAFLEGVFLLRSRVMAGFGLFFGLCGGLLTWMCLLLWHT